MGWLGDGGVAEIMPAMTRKVVGPAIRLADLVRGLKQAGELPGSVNTGLRDTAGHL